MPTFINDPTLPKPDFPGSHMVVDEHHVFISGLTIADITDESVTHSHDAGKETHRIMRELERMLRQEELDLSDVVRVDIHLTDLDDLNKVNSAYAEFFEPGRFPARTCTEASRLQGASKVEITLMASRRHADAPSDAKDSDDTVPDSDTGPE
ncbi:RidA family protein [Halomonas aquamarina]|uniref:RidA family protein n=1 Tax=Vreelandella aquamarina TaxID=77097 RepID=A0ACC5VX30_9GAMM|nr:RidA family protein [Halomonas aquamarina]MBZ5488346.1 RidA family protein [Halomonas aquamarina]